MADSIIRCSEHLQNFTLIDNTCLQTPTLSMQAMGLFAYLMTLPSNWTIYKNELVKHFSNGRDAVYKAFNELIDAGFITYIQNTDEAGRFTGNTYYIHEQPVEEKDRTVRPVRNKTEKTSATNTVNCNTVNGKPQSENPYTENPSLLSTNNTKDLLPSTNSNSNSHYAPFSPTEQTDKTSFIPQSDFFSEQSVNSNSHSVSNADSDENKKETLSFKQEEYTQVYNIYLENCKILFQQGKIPVEKPVIPIHIKKLIKRRFTDYGVDKILLAVKNSVNNSWLVNNAKYSITALFSDKIITDLINGTYTNNQPDRQPYQRGSPPRQWTDDHLML